MGLGHLPYWQTSPSDFRGTKPSNNSSGNALGNGLCGGGESNPLGDSAWGGGGRACWKARCQRRGREAGCRECQSVDLGRRAQLPTSLPTHLLEPPEGEEQPNQPGGAGKEGKGRAPNQDGRGPGALPLLPQPPAPSGAQRLESPRRGRSQAVNAASGPVLPTGPSPPPHLKTLERLHRGLDALLGRPPRQPPGRGQRLANLLPSLPRPCHSSGRRGRAARTPKQSGSRAA